MVRARKHSKDYSEGIPITRVNAVKTMRPAKEKRPTLSDMPENVLLDIYKHLPVHKRIQAESLCRRFRNVLKAHAFRDITELSYGMLLWEKSERLRGKPRRHIGKGSIESLLARCGRYLTAVYVGSFPARLHSPVVQLLPTTCPRIRKLNLSGLRVASWFVASTSIKYLPAIEVLDISRCQQLTQDGVLSMKDVCPNLKDLDISDNGQLLDHHDLIFDGWKRLEIFRFNRLWTSKSGYLLFNDMPALKECYMRDSEVVRDRMLVTLCNAAPNLVVLEFSSFFGMTGLTEFAFSKLPRLRNLEHVSARDMELTERKLMWIVANGRLKHLEMSFSNRLGNSAVKAVLDSCKELTFLKVSKTSIDKAAAPHFLAYADEFEEGRPELHVTTENEGLIRLLKAHPKIKCTCDY